MAADILSSRALNRALLARQLLLERDDRPTLAAIDHLVGMQAQVPHNPYVALWSRLARFDPTSLSQLLEDRDAVRIVAMRGTLHLLSADDCLVLRPMAQPVLDDEMRRHGEHARHLDGLDLGPILDVARPYLDEAPRTGAQLRSMLADAFPDLDAAALALACRNRLALVQVPPRGLWGRSAAVTLTTAEAWLGRDLDPSPDVDAIMRRVINAFGPMAAADLATWSRLTGMGAVLDRLRPHLRPFRDERDRELLDEPDAPRPEPDIPAPVRFLPEYDNVLLSHADRSRIVTDEVRQRFQVPDRGSYGWILIDGFVRGRWQHADADEHGRATITVTTVGTLNRRVQDRAIAEGRRLLRMLTPSATERDVRITAIE